MMTYFKNILTEISTSVEAASIIAEARTPFQEVLKENDEIKSEIKKLYKNVKDLRYHDELAEPLDNFLSEPIIEAIINKDTK